MKLDVVDDVAVEVDVEVFKSPLNVAVDVVAVGLSDFVAVVSLRGSKLLASPLKSTLVAVERRR